MATVYWTGGQLPRAYARQSLVTAVSATQTLIVTINSKAETVTATGSSVITFATEAVAQLQASPIPEFRQITWTNPSDGVVLGTGPSDGRPVTIAYTGTCTHTDTTNATALSPFDVNDTANYAGGALPVNGDVFVIEDTDKSLLYNLAAITSITYTLVRRTSHTGPIGLPSVNPLGFPEYLAVALEGAGTAVTIEDNGAASFVRFKSTAGSAVTLTVTAPDRGGSLDSEGVEVWGTPASSVVNVNGGALAFAPLTSQVATGATVRVADGSFRCGPSATLGTLTFDNSAGDLSATYTTLTLDQDSTVAVRRAAAGTNTNIDSGTLTWNSTGGIGATAVSSDGTLDMRGAPTAVTTGTITVSEGATIRDPYKRLTRTVTFTVLGEMSRINWEMGTNNTVAFS